MVTDASVPDVHIDTLQAGKLRTNDGAQDGCERVMCGAVIDVKLQHTPANPCRHSFLEQAYVKTLAQVVPSQSYC